MLQFRQGVVAAVEQTSGTVGRETGPKQYCGGGSTRNECDCDYRSNDH